MPPVEEVSKPNQGSDSPLDMLDAILGQSPVAEPAPKAEEPVKVEEKPVEPIKAEDEKPEVKAEEPKAEEPKAETDPLEEWRKKMNDMAGSLQPQPPAPKKEEPKAEVKPVEKPSEVPPPPAAKVGDFEISDEEFAEAVTTKDGLQKLLKKAREFDRENIETSARTKATEEALLKVTPIVRDIVTQQIQLNNIVTDFWKVNEDLAPYRKYVGHVANLVSAQHPDWAFDKVFEETAKVTRADLKIEKPEEPSPRSGQRPAFAKPAGGSRKPAGAPKSQLEEDLAKFIF